MSAPPPEDADKPAGARLEPSVEANPQAADAKSLRILVVDDHEETLTALRYLLELWGHEVRAASDGPTALVAAPELSPDLVLLDIGLPKMDGWEVARRLRRMPEAAGATLVALTGYSQPSNRRHSRMANFDLHLRKPVHPDELKRLLADWTSEAFNDG